MRIFLRWRILQERQGRQADRRWVVRGWPAAQRRVRGAAAVPFAETQEIQAASMRDFNPCVTFPHTSSLGPHFSRMASRSARFCTARRRRSCSAWLLGSSSKGMSTGFLEVLTGGREAGQGKGMVGSQLAGEWQAEI